MKYTHENTYEINSEKNVGVFAEIATQTQWGFNFLLLQNCISICLKLFKGRKGFF